MAPDAEDCEEVEQLNGDYQEDQVHQGRRILPDEPPPAQAWIENEELGPGNDSRTNSPGENRRLLGNKTVQKPSSRLQAGLTLGVWAVSKKQSKCPPSLKKGKPQAKTKFQKRKEKFFEVFGLPQFIITMLFIFLAFHYFGPNQWRAKMEWVPGAWWHEPWRLFTYGLLHAGGAHLALNSLVALVVGWRLEHEQGWSRVAVVWAGGVAAGALGAGALQPRVHVVGASAAVYALLTAHLPNVCLRYGHIPLWWFRPLSMVVLGASEGCWALIRAPDAKAVYNVAWSAHALGAAVGVPLGFIIFKGENSSKRVIFFCRIVSSLILSLGIATAVVFYVFCYDADLYS
ncbi:rhomboid-related protein 2-like [Melitaea cinxia]|uniref:rhomboid-related protein 2-like n=1 Tax=Melitaea cinxia TaxID=113334 RepID=UPI001E2732B0|nr:rhomboid-related protein 2-like [Melitaea cinxia]